jgi:hypothetical protein
MTRAWLAIACVACGGQVAPGSPDGARSVPDATVVASPDASPDADLRSPLTKNRDRLLATYLAFLESDPTVTQTNGLSGADVATVCELWTKLDPSSRDVFLTLTARMEGSIVTADGSAMLDHVVKLYRLTGGQGATATAPGTCGGGEYNRMIMSMDPELQGVLVAANQDQGASRELLDIPASSYWRDSHDLAGPHPPFDLSDETNQGGPRGQVQYFRNPTSALANSPLGRQDLAALVDPLALEMDQDYDCGHNSNPLCSYYFYGPLCAFETKKIGTAIYTAAYGSFDPTYTPCR